MIGNGGFHVTLHERLLLPLASTSDAERTVDALIAALGEEADETIVVPLHVIEKGGGSIDKLPVDIQQDQASDLLEYAIGALESAGFTVEPNVVYGTDVVDAVSTFALEEDVTAIAFLPRPGGLLSKLLTGDRPGRFLEQSPVPVIVLPQPSDG